MLCNTCSNKGMQRDSLVLCDTCYNINNMFLISTPIVIDMYGLNSRDIKNLNYCLYNDYFHNNLKLYLISDIEDTAVVKYGSRKKVIEVAKNKRELKERRRLDKLKDIKSRRVSINNILFQCSSDEEHYLSSKCEKYVKDGEQSGYCLDDIYQEMEEYRFLKKRCDLKQVLKMVRLNYKEYESEEQIQFAKDIAATLFVVKNINNTHLLFKDIPNSLYDKIKSKSELVYEKGSSIDLQDNFETLLSDHPDLFQQDLDL